MAIKQKVGNCIKCGKSAPLTAKKCPFCYKYDSAMKSLEKAKAKGKSSIIPHRSEKQLARDLKYAKIRKSWLPDHKRCEANLPGCSIESTQVHHKEGRSGDLLFDTTKFLAVCWNCHNKINEHSAGAIESGLSLKRNN